MVNFEDGATVGTPPQELLKILVLQSREDVLSAWKGYFQTSSRTGQERTEALASNMRAFFMQVQEMIRNDYGKDQEGFNKLQNTILSTQEPRELMKAWNTINEILYKKNIIKIDTRRQVDQFNVEATNEQYER